MICPVLDATASFGAPVIARAPLVGVLALQGAFREHRSALERVGARALEVRRPEQLSCLDGLVIPGGESSTMTRLMRDYRLDEAIRCFSQDGGPVWGTCAGAIAVASVIEGYPEQPRLGLLDVRVVRNAYGRQRASFEADIDVVGWERPFRALFIRAPSLGAVGSGVRVLATFAGQPVAIADGRTLATVFHPELTGDDRWHRAFVTHCIGVRVARRRAAATADATGEPGPEPAAPESEAREARPA